MYPLNGESSLDELRVLIVDDSETMRRLLRAIIGSRQWTVCGEAETGVGGVEKFAELKPDLVLIDLALPDINGMEVARRISAMGNTVPLILFTVLDVDGLKAAAGQAGISQVVSKAQVWDLIRSIELATGDHQVKKESEATISVQDPK